MAPFTSPRYASPCPHYTFSPILLMQEEEVLSLWVAGVAGWGWEREQTKGELGVLTSSVA